MQEIHVIHKIGRLNLIQVIVNFQVVIRPYPQVLHNLRPIQNRHKFELILKNLVSEGSHLRVVVILVFKIGGWLHWLTLLLFTALGEYY